MSWITELRRLLRAEFFSSRPQGVMSGVAFIISALTALGIFFKVVDLGPKVAPDQPAFLTYVWTTFTISCFFLAATLLLLQRLLRRHQEMSKLGEQQKVDQAKAEDQKVEQRLLRDRAMQLQHRMAEGVRVAADEAVKAAAAGKLSAISVNACVDRVIGGELCEYLKARLGNHEFHCTIKRISRPSASVGFDLKDEYRDGGQNVSTRPGHSSEPADQNYIYLRFLEPGKDDAKQIYIPSIQSSNAMNRLKTRAHERGYDSMLAFPLNLPHPSHPLGLGRLVGFLGLDSPDPHAFDGLFSFSKKSDLASSNGSVDGVYTPLDELHLLYGLADSIATILMLVPRPSATGSAS